MAAEVELVEQLSRVAELLAMGFAPRWLSPEPKPLGAGAAALSIVALAALLVGAGYFARRLRTRLATAAAVLWLLAVVAAVIGSAYFSGGRGPLGRALLFTAPVAWLALAATLAAAAGAALGARFRPAALVAGAVVVAGAAAVLATGASLMTSPDAMWERALTLEPDNERAVAAVAARLETKRDLTGLRTIADACIGRDPRACGCLVLRAKAELRLHQADDAFTHARAATDLCADRASAHAALAEALFFKKDYDDALEEANRGLALLAADPAAEAWLHYASALALEGLGRREEAREAIDKAVALGADRDARLAAANIAGGQNRLDDAQRLLDMLVADDPTDADALYNRALIAHRRDDYNGARQGYLATLAVDPHYVWARYNLAVLTWQKGFRPEAQHHVRKFLEDFPDSPDGPKLVAMVGGLEPEAPPVPAPPTSSDGPPPPSPASAVAPSPSASVASTPAPPR